MKLYFKIFYIYIFKYLFIYLLESQILHSTNPTPPHPSTLNPKYILVNPSDIRVFFPSLKMRVKMISVNMKSGTMNVVFVAISQKIIQICF